jgi:hypothetical protein
MTAATCVAVVVLAACTSSAATSASEEPVAVEPIAETDIQRVTLTASAAERLNIQTTTVEPSGDGRVVPSAAVIIDTTGTYWVYTNPEPFVFVRQEIRPVHEEGLQAFFENGPETGTPVVTLGVPELYGAEFGIGK